MKQNYEYRREAKDIMDGKYGKVIITHILLAIIAGLPGGIGQTFEPKYEVISWVPFERILVEAGNPALVQFFNLISFILTAIISYAIVSMYISMTKNNTESSIESVIKVGFVEQPVRSVIHSFIVTVFTFLWTLLLVIPGIMAIYKYAMGFYILSKESNISAYDAVVKSKELMMGNRMKLFMLDMSYLVWYLIGILTFGILWLWIFPKHMTARILFFNDLYPVERVSVV